MLHKLLILIVITTLVSARHNGQLVHHLPMSILLRAQKITLPCIEQTKANHDIFGKLLAGTLDKDETSRNWMWCFTQTGKFLDEQGHFNVTTMARLVGDNPLIPAFQEYLLECNKITKETGIDTAYAMDDCLNENSPIVFSL